MTKFAKGCVLVLAALIGCGIAMGQNASKAAPVDVAVTYDALRSNHITGDNFWAQGGAVELGGRFYRGLGVAARVEGSHAGAGSTNGVPLNLVTAVFGVRYTVASHSGRYVIFGEGLRNESVVGGVVDGRVENAVEPDESAQLVEFILHAGAERNFDDAVKFLREFVAGSYVVPGMNHR